MPLSSNQRLLVTRRFQRSIATLTARAAAASQRAWDQLPGYDESDIDTLTARTKTTLTAVKQSSVAAAAGYYAVLAGIRPVPVKPAAVPSEANLREPFISYWQALSSGIPVAAALLAGRSRVEAVVSNFANTTARQTGGLVLATARVEVNGWERITDSGACEWCQDKATHVYRTADGADFGHDRCGCTPVPRLT